MRRRRRRRSRRRRSRRRRSRRRRTRRRRREINFTIPSGVIKASANRIDWLYYHLRHNGTEKTTASMNNEFSGKSFITTSPLLFRSSSILTLSFQISPSPWVSIIARLGKFPRRLLYHYCEYRELGTSPGHRAHHTCLPTFPHSSPAPRLTKD